MKQINIFQNNSEEQRTVQAPLADRMRPVSFEEFVGQKHLLSEGKILRRLLDSRRLHSLIFWGPPGAGKTTLARIVAAATDAHLVELSAVMAGTKEIRAAVDVARQVWSARKRRTWLFMDEIHRLNKAQQDTLLPHVENGVILLLGATTENPSFEVIRPLLSRTHVLVLNPLSDEELREITRRAMDDEEKGLGRFSASLTEQAVEYLVSASGGDARVMLNAMEIAVMTTPPGKDGIRAVDFSAIQEALQRRSIHYDKGGEEHFNSISALQKSIRGSDPDAGLYWLARMLGGGEDPLYIARRLVRTAVEDIGLADPSALVQAVSAMEAYRFLGSPEGDLALAQLVVYLAVAPKSNSVDVAFSKAREVAGRTGSLPVPMHIRNAPTGLLKTLGYGRGYQYPHDDPEGWVTETYLPDSLSEKVFYEASPRGWEGSRKELLEQRRSRVQAWKSTLKTPNGEQ